MNGKVGVFRKGDRSTTTSSYEYSKIFGLVKRNPLELCRRAVESIREKGITDHVGNISNGLTQKFRYITDHVMSGILI